MDQDDRPEAKTSAEPEIDEEGPRAEVDLEESHPPPDYGRVCQEIDRFILAVSSSSGGEPDVPECVEQFAVLVEAKIESCVSVKWSRFPEENSSSFLDAVDRVWKLLNSLAKFSLESKFAPWINRIGCILQRSMSYLQDEFRSLLEDPKLLDFDLNHESKTKQSSSNSNQEGDPPLPEESGSAGDNNFPGYSEEVILNLNKLAKAMLSAGFETECFLVYIVARRTVLENTVHKLGFDKLSIDDVQKMQWEPLEREIASWNKLIKQYVAVIFPGEHKLSEAVFSDRTPVADRLFGNLSWSVMIQLLNFAEAVAMTKRSSEKLFKFLDIYETLRDVISATGNLRHEESVNELKSEALLICSQLGEAIVLMFCELENSIKAYTGKTPVPGGAVHPMTSYTMNYLQYAFEYRETLDQVFREHQTIQRADSVGGSDYEHNAARAGGGQNSNADQTAKPPPFAIQIHKVMDLLHTNLEEKSKQYKDTSLSLIFMMNNGRYVMQKMKRLPEISKLMGDNWTRKMSSDLRQYHKNYVRETWGRPLNCLNPEGLSVNGKVVKPVLKERFKSFNAMFEEIHKTQSTWVVSDNQLQSELRVSISSVVIPAYRSFLARFSQTFTPGRQTEKYVKHQPEDIETSIENLFDGNAASTGKKKP
ncbi:exocyst complex component EXO70B1-like [Diospyros lotus]|uniref:exocyst complex component EXO70B1-like n=1 Tax=Diospyros lotus TaxID=55363 RepID=UPI002251F391|nr:exocyst complex component EXO70B1-like [Diospyros lotus]